MFAGTFSGTHTRHRDSCPTLTYHKCRTALNLDSERLSEYHAVSRLRQLILVWTKRNNVSSPSGDEQTTPQECIFMTQ